MPEGDTVWRTARALDRALSGEPLVESDFRVPAFAESTLVGHTVLETVSRGKHLLTRVDEFTVHTHLKMEGSWHIYKPDSRWTSPAHQARLVLATAAWRAVGFRLGVVEIVERSREHEVVGHLGPDLLGTDWSCDEAVRRLDAQPDRPISEALLDQRNLAGIGNLYQAELCFLFGVHPGSPVREVDDLARLVQRAHQLLAANRERVEQSTTGDLRRGQTHYVYRRAAQPCRRCRTPISTATLPTSARQAHSARATFWCPRCQPER